MKIFNLIEANPEVKEITVLIWCISWYKVHKLQKIKQVEMITAYNSCP